MDLSRGLHLTIRVTLGKLLFLSEPHCFHLLNISNTFFLII